MGKYEEVLRRVKRCLFLIFLRIENALPERDVRWKKP
jgi:hypothetical protein